MVIVSGVTVFVTVTVRNGPGTRWHPVARGVARTTSCGGIRYRDRRLLKTAPRVEAELCLAGSVPESLILGLPFDVDDPTDHDDRDQTRAGQLERRCRALNAGP